ncbi:MAG: B12-binding domain-containing radical SAM protein [Myxococcales bacterium]
MAKNLLTGPTKCLLVRPEFLENTFYNLTEVFRTLGGKSPAPALGALVAAAYLPEHWELKYVDADVEPLLDEHFQWADIVMVSGIGPQQETILKAIARAKRYDKPTVVGGAAPTLQPDKYIGKADFVVSGEAETTLPKLLEDLGAGKTSGYYESSDRASMAEAKVPRYDLAKLDRYMFVGMNYTRGCPFSCEFCALIEIFGKKSRTKSAEQMVKELQCLYDLGYRGMVDFGYDNLIGDIKHTEEVLTAMAKWLKEHGNPFAFTTEATMNLAKLPKLMEAMKACDFRYVFIGIESSEEDVLKKTQKGQNTAMPAEEAVRIINSYGLVVNTGLILGFDGEKKGVAENMLKMVQTTGAFPTLVLALHALPRSALMRRMAAEGRLFGGGIDILDEDRTDTATTGLNFVTSRPRAEILEDLAHVLEELYAPRNHYARVEKTVRQLKRVNQFMPPPKMVAKLAKSFVKIVATIGRDPETAPYFWKALAKTMATNPAAAEVVLGQAVFNWNYAKQARTYVAALREEIAKVHQMGEAAYNAKRLAPKPGSAPVKPAPQVASEAAV